jgi:hypothetical protein
MSPSASQPLTNDQRRAAFFIAAVAVLGALLLLGGLSRSGHTRGSTRPVRRAAAREAPRIVDVFARTAAAPGETATATIKPATDTTGPTGVRGHASTSSIHAIASPAGTRTSPVNPRLVLAHARQFLAAYLVYEVGPLDPRMRRALTGSATPRFAHALLVHPVRLPQPDRPAVGVIQTLELGSDPDSSSVTVDATVENAGWISGLVLDFQRANGRWLVSGLN